MTKPFDCKQLTLFVKQSSMKVCVFEWISGGGCKFDGISLTAPDAGLAAMLKQGKGMLEAVVEDFARAGHEVVWLQDSRLDMDTCLWGRGIVIDDGSKLPRTLIKVGKTCDAILIVAPESSGTLLMVSDWLLELKHRLISPDREFVKLAANKLATCSRLAERGVSVPKGCCLAEFKEFNQLHPMRYPLVLKPIDGAGSEQIRLIRTDAELVETHANVNFRIEEFVPGLATSVSALCNGCEFQLLPATQQIFDAEPIGHYVGAKYPLPDQLLERASVLAAQALHALPPTRGYVGIDLVLSASSPEQDVVIEVNPRLTTSYLTLRQVCGFNIADRMLQGLASS
jgi:predicted ATP-grasp superfamily ATP-dependent carboligase